MDKQKNKATDLRKAAGCSVEIAADIVRVAKRTWLSYEKGERKIPDSTVELFVIKSGLSLAEWTDWEVEFLNLELKIKSLSEEREFLSDKITGLNREINRVSLKYSQHKKM